MKPSRLLVAGATAALSFFVGGWSAVTLLRPATVSEERTYVLVAAESGRVGHTLRLNATAEWRATRSVRSTASGTVTTINIKDGARVNSGAVLFTVDLRPVIIASGKVPSFRDLGQGDDGRDVAQLQRLLVATGHGGNVTGRFTAETAAAVRQWQKSLGLEANGTVRQGDIMYVPDLPSRVALDPTVQVGSAATGATVKILAARPMMTISLTDSQAGMVQPDQRVTLSKGDQTWAARVRRIEAGSAETGHKAILAAVADGPICGSSCERIPFGAPISIESEVEVVPDTRGITVPTGALFTRADGATGVRLESGNFREVTIVASSAGMAVVDGIDEGTKVRTPGDVQ